MNKQKLLIVDDEKKLRELLTNYLSKEGFEVSAVADGVEMDEHLACHKVDLVVLDLMLPGEDGLSIGRRLHQKNNLPVIILSARSDEIDRIVGLEIGADDYLAKPFNPRELLARIRSVLRRNATEASTESKTKQPIITNFGPFCLNLNKHELTKNDQIVALTTGEFNMLSIFINNIDRVLSRDQLLEMTKGYDRDPFDRSVDICIGRLRKKIEGNPSNPIYLKTIWGSGYLFTTSQT
ncbi:MAG: response regulator [Candidatus Thioglobus sp.]|nr:response regulator [Candidatus Thioglobus pontius]MBL6977275.1 response regulator [Candidatus Thioglobus sp.]MBL6984151.1 response regulator [Candidatus Thioglobus sp.]